MGEKRPRCYLGVIMEQMKPVVVKETGVGDVLEGQLNGGHDTLAQSGFDFVFTQCEEAGYVDVLPGPIGRTGAAISRQRAGRSGRMCVRLLGVGVVPRADPRRPSDLAETFERQRARMNIIRRERHITGFRTADPLQRHQCGQHEAEPHHWNTRSFHIVR